MKRKIKKFRSHIHHYKTEVFAVSIVVCIVSFLFIFTTLRDKYITNIFGLTQNDILLQVLYFDRITDARFYFALGNNYFGDGQIYNIQKAEKYYLRALSLDEKLPLANYQLARLYFVSNKQDKALTYIDRELLYYPEYKRSYYIRGLINGYADNLPAAVEDFKMFLAWKPDSWAGHNDLAWIYFRQGDFANAYETSVEGLRYSPGNPWLLNSVGVALKNLGDKEEAKRAFTLSLQKIEKLTPEVWGRAYPGNDPHFYDMGLSNMRETVETNLQLL
jgi:hypothetical protein